MAWAMMSFLMTIPANPSSAGRPQSAARKSESGYRLLQTLQDDGKNTVSVDDALLLLREASRTDSRGIDTGEGLWQCADAFRQRQTGSGEEKDFVTCGVSTSLFLTNLCEMKPAFAAYPRSPGDPDAWILTIDDIDATLEQAIALACAHPLQVSLTGGGYWPPLFIPGLEHAEVLRTYGLVLSHIRTRSPEALITGFSPDEIEFLHIVSGRSAGYVLDFLRDHGLDQLGGWGTELLDDAYRLRVSKKKASVKRWTDIAKLAHQRKIPVVARLESLPVDSRALRMKHLLVLRQLASTHHDLFSHFEPFVLEGNDSQSSPAEHPTASRRGRTRDGAAQSQRTPEKNAALPTGNDVTAGDVPKTTAASKRKLAGTHRTAHAKALFGDTSVESSGSENNEPDPSLLLLQEQRLTTAMTRIILGDVISQQQVFRGVQDQRIAQAAMAQELLQWGGNAFGGTDALSYQQFTAGSPLRQLHADALRLDELEALIRQAGRVPKA